MMTPVSSSSSSPAVRVEKATSEFLIGPDWTMNIDICDAINSYPGLARDVVKAVKKRLQHKNPKVQLLALTLLETIVKNCGDYVHFHIAEKNVLQEMIKIVKKKADMHVREKILMLLDSWQEAFGGPGGKHPQYYWAYDELRRFGVEFPPRSSDTAPIFTPPVSRPTQGHPQVGYGMPSNSSTRLDEAMATEIENLSLSSLNTMRNALDLLADMLQAVNPSQRMAVNDEVIVDLVDRCRANQKKLMQMLTTTGDEELLGQGLELNDNLQNVLAKHDAIVSGSPLPTQVTNFKPQSTEVHDSDLRSAEVRERSPTSDAKASTPVVALTRGQVEEEEEEEDDFAQLARRHSRVQSTASHSTSNESNNGATSVNANSTTSFTSAAEPVPNNALALPDPPTPVKTSKEQDMIDFLSLTLSTSTISPHTPQSPAFSAPNVHQAPVSPTPQGIPYAGNDEQVPLNSYVVPWAQAQAQPQSQSQSQLRPQPQSQPQPQPQPQPQLQYPQYSFGYPPPPWASTPGYLNGQNPLSSAAYSSSYSSTGISYMPVQGTRPLQPINPYPARVTNGSAINGGSQMGFNPRTTAPAAGQKPFIPSYKLFDDLNVLGSADGRYKMTSNPSPSLSGTSSQSMVGGRK